MRKEKAAAARGADRSTGNMKINAMNHVKLVKDDATGSVKFVKIGWSVKFGETVMTRWSRVRTEKRANVWRRQMGTVDWGAAKSVWPTRKKVGGGKGSLELPCSPGHAVPGITRSRKETWLFRLLSASCLIKGKKVNDRSFGAELAGRFPSNFVSV